MKASPEEFTAIRRKCDAFRRAVRLCAAAGDDSRLSWARRFPRECCDFASKLLFLALYESGLRDIKCVNVKVGDGRHVWLEWKDLTIDISADQFPEFDGFVLARESEWHMSKGGTRGFASCGDSEAEAYQNLHEEPFEMWYEQLMRFWQE